MVPRFSYLLDDVTRVDPTELRLRGLKPAVVLMFLLLKEAPDHEHLGSVLVGWWDILLDLMRQPDRAEILSALLSYVHTVSSTSPAELTALMARLGPEAEEVAMTTADMLRAEGEARGEANHFLKLLSLKFGPLPEEVQGRVRAASTKQVDVWTERFLDATSLNQILG